MYRVKLFDRDRCYDVAHGQDSDDVQGLYQLWTTVAREGEAFRVEVE